MMLCVCSTQAAAQALSDAVDAALGYPRAGVDIGGGVHAPASQSVTARYSYIIQHPTQPLWGYMVDGVPAPTLAVLAAPAAQAATAAWTAPVQATPAQAVK